MSVALGARGVLLLCLFLSLLEAAIPETSDYAAWDAILELQGAVNYTRPDGSINCDGRKPSLPTCVDGKANRRSEPLPFDGSGACDDVIRTMSLLTPSGARAADDDCEDEASNAPPAL
jgi:hypothetical protein